jgi:hypothetical protein
MKNSPELKNLAAALSKAQAEIRGALKDQQNPYFKSKYADLASVWDACREPLTKNGLSVVQVPEVVEDKIYLVTALLHSSGEWISGGYPIIPIKPDPQSLGSAMTYARRYALSAIVGVCPEDDDGEASMSRNQTHRPETKTKAEPAPETTPSPFLSERQLAQFFAVVKETGWDKPEANLKDLISAKWGIKSRKEIPVGLFKEILDYLRANRWASLSAPTDFAPSDI